MLTNLLLNLALSQTHSTITTASASGLESFSSTASIQTESRLLINQVPCGDNPENTYFISKDTEFTQVSACPLVNSSIFINGEYDITTLSQMSNIKGINGDLVIQNSHNIYNLKGLENLTEISGYDLYLDHYALYISDNENLGYTDKVNWTHLVGSNPFSIDRNTDLDSLECYNGCDGCFGPGPYLCQTCKNFTFYDNQTCTSVCDNIVSTELNICQVRPPNQVFLDYLTGYSFVYLDWGSHDVYSDLIDGYTLYHNDDIVLETNITDSGYYFNQSNLIINHTMIDLIPGTSFNCSVQAHSKFGYSDLNLVQIDLPEYIPENITSFNWTYPDTNNVTLIWNVPTLPEETFFMTNNLTIFYEYYLDDVADLGLTFSNNLSFSMLAYGNHIIHIKPVVQITNSAETFYFYGNYINFTFASIYTTTTPTTSLTTQSTSVTTSTSTLITQYTTTTPEHSGMTPPEIIAVAIFLSILGIALVYVLYRCHKDRENFIFMKKMRDKNAVDFSNPVYETNNYNTYDNGIVMYRDGAQNNPIYHENDPEQDYYAV